MMRPLNSLTMFRLSSVIAPMFLLPLFGLWQRAVLLPAGHKASYRIKKQSPLSLSSTMPSGRLLSSEIQSRLEELKAEDETVGNILQLETIGFSVQGQDIVLARLGRGIEGLPCVYVICRQHGDESAPTEAALRLIKEFVENEERRALLDHVTLCIVSVMNPDGTDVFRRNNAAGVNLNRDWVQQSQPETVAVARSIAECRPTVIIDAHENYPWEHEGQYIEPCSGQTAFAKNLMTRLCRAIRQQTAAVGDALRLATSRSGSSALAHRYWSKRGIPALLIESEQRHLGQGTDIERRQRIHQIAILTAMHIVVD